MVPKLSRLCPEMQNQIINKKVHYNNVHSPNQRPFRLFGIVYMYR